MFNFNNMKLSLKIASGIGLVATLFIILGVYTIINLSKINNDVTDLSAKYVPLVESMASIEKVYLKANLYSKAYVTRADEKSYKNAEKYINKTNEEIHKLEKQVDKFQNMKSMIERLEEFDEFLQEGKSLLKKMKEKNIELDKLMAEANEYGKALSYDLTVYSTIQSQKIKKDIKSNKPLNIVSNRIIKMLFADNSIDIIKTYRINALKAIIKNDNLYMKDNLVNLDKIYSEVDKILTMTTKDVDRNKLNNIKKNLKNYQETVLKIVKTRLKLDELEQNREKVSNNALAFTELLSIDGFNSIKTNSTNAGQVQKTVKDFIFAGLVTCVLLAIFGCWVIISSITKPISKIVEKLNNTSNAVTEVSGQISSSSQQLASGSAEQASSIEETSSTLEESSSMVKQNTENTNQAAGLAKQTKYAADKGYSEMTEMMDSMQEIKKSSDEIGKIIKVIDEIAFQTNILSLNAAVEAARAGEAGKGFAVVAEEVRSLAQRSAQAAKDTAGIIENNINLSEQGVYVAQRVNSSLSEINDQAQKVSELLDEVSTASQEQAQGISQINNAISQMEQIVQNNATTAEQGANAADSMSVQAVNMKNIINELIVMINGANKSTIADQYSNVSVQEKKSVPNRIKKTAQITIDKTPNKPVSKVKKNLRSNNTKVVSPEDVIPLEDDTEGF